MRLHSHGLSKDLSVIYVSLILNSLGPQGYRLTDLLLTQLLHYYILVPSPYCLVGALFFQSHVLGACPF